MLPRRGVAAGGMVTAIMENGEPKMSNPVRGHGNKPRNRSAAGKEPASRWTLKWLDDAAVAASRDKSKAKAESESHLLNDLPVPAKPVGNEKRVVSYGLYGSDPKYCTGAIRNSELAPGSTFFWGESCQGTHRPLERGSPVISHESARCPPSERVSRRERSPRRTTRSRVSRDGGDIDQLSHSTRRSPT